MSKWEQPYRVFVTACHPAKYKVGRFEEDDNATKNYFTSIEEATAYANKLNSLGEAERLRH